MDQLPKEGLIKHPMGYKIYDTSLFTSDYTLETDVVIVGTGAGGGVTAEILSQAGIRTILVEEGPYRDSSHFKMKETDAYPDLYQESAARKTRDKSISIYQGRCVGGSTTVNWTTSFRTPETTLNYWVDAYGLHDYSSEKLKPWFELMEQRLNIVPWPVPPNENNHVLAKGAEKLGWSYGAINRNIQGCGNLGYCGVGCPLDAKQSMLVTTIPEALNRGAVLLTRTRAIKLTGTQNQADWLECLPLNRRGTGPGAYKLRIKARYFVLSSGAMGSPSVIMRSPGLDPYHQAGKRTFLHPVNISAGIFSHKINGYHGAPQSVYSDHFMNQDVSGPVGFKLEVAPVHPLLTAGTLRQYGSGFKKLMKQFPHIHVMIALLRDGFHLESKGGDVVLLSDGTPALDYPLTPYLWEGFRRSYQAMAEIQWAAGAKGVMPVHDFGKMALSRSQSFNDLKLLPLRAGWAKVVSAHVMGGCPMGHEDDESVVNLDGKHHFRDNLFVIDGSVFPTSIGANPQLSIYGISARNASKLRDLILQQVSYQ